jgi:hypothetical protein
VVLLGDDAGIQEDDAVADRRACTYLARSPSRIRQPMPAFAVQRVNPMRGRRRRVGALDDEYD